MFYYYVVHDLWVHGLGGAPEEIRTPDPQIRSLSLVLQSSLSSSARPLAFVHPPASVSNRGVAAVDQEIGAGDERRVLAGEIHRARGDLIGRAETAHKRVV
jgi:hypothetical protein